MKRIYRIGTRDSRLARWQADHVAASLQALGAGTEIIPIKSDGDIDLVSPLYEMGVQGIFTKTLDAALLSSRIDIAVHSLKDVPTALPRGLCLVAVPERENHRDALVFKDKSFEPEKHETAHIATSSLRRRSQWLNRFPAHRMENLRGNIQTRLEKIKNEASIDAAVFAYAGIKRLDMEVPNMRILDWMLPAPAQGALGIVCRSADEDTVQLCRMLNHEESELCTGIERAFLRRLMGGCSMPVGALAEAEGDQIRFQGNLLSKDGQRRADTVLVLERSEGTEAGSRAAEELLRNGGDEIAKELKELK